MNRKIPISLLPVLLIAILGIASITTELCFIPPFDSYEWVSYQITLLSITALAGFAIWNWFFPSHPGCNLFFYLQRETDKCGNWRGREGSCLGFSVGRVEVKEARCSDGKYMSTGRRYFCRVHDPRNAWMQDWLKEHKIQIVLKTIRKLRFTNETP